MNYGDFRTYSIPMWSDYLWLIGKYFGFLHSSGNTTVCDHLNNKNKNSWENSIKLKIQLHWNTNYFEIFWLILVLNRQTDRNEHFNKEFSIWNWQLVEFIAQGCQSFDWNDFKFTNYPYLRTLYFQSMLLTCIKKDWFQNVLYEVRILE